ncbi:MAG: tetratricopeptide repeat protein [Planctomycetota bacterium]
MADDPVTRWRAAVEQNPRNELALFSLAKAYFDRHDHAQAIPQFERAVALKPDWMMAHILLGRAHLARGDTAQAKSCFERGLELAIAQHHEGPEAEMRELLEELE